MTAKIDGTNGLLQNYDYQVPTTGFSYTFAAGTTVLVINPAGTLATGTITMPASPADGMTITFSSTKQITALTLSGNTGQTVVSAVTFLSANQALSYVYRLSNTTWYPFGTQVAQATGPAFSAYASAATSAATGTFTKIAFATEEFDTNNNFASDRFTPTIAGYYQINGCIGGAFSTLIISIYKNGSEYKRGVASAGVTLNQANVSSLVYLNGSTDYVEIYAFQSSGSTQSFSSSSTLTYFNGCLLRGA